MSKSPGRSKRERGGCNTPIPEAGSDRLWGMIAVGGLVLIGLAVGLPTLPGDFLAGDDAMLLRDHALINHPSIANAIELFKIVHRDLYQPLPMLSFQFDFVLYGRDLAEGRTWGIHFTNVVYHILNGVLTWVLIGRLTRNRLLAFLVGSAFLSHPLAIESVAWMSGRMMLMSAFFLLLTLICFDCWQVSGKWGWLVVSVLFCLACMVSKVRIELPILLILMRYYRKMDWKAWPWWGGFGLLTAMTAGFSMIAIETSTRAGVWEDAGEVLAGSGFARATHTLGWYFSHYFWPANLSGWYYPPLEIAWSQPAVLASVLLIGVCLGGTAWWWRQGHRSAVGMVFFLAGIGPMLQFIPMRLTLACDRYMYIPMIGLHWMIGTMLLWSIGWARRRSWGGRPAGFAAAIGVVVLGLWIRGSVLHGRHYGDDVALRRRDTELYPKLPATWARLAWAHIRQGQYEAAIEVGKKGMKVPNREDSLSEQAIGWAHFEMGNYVQAAKYLEEALRVDPSTPKPPYRLARVYESQGKYQEAVALYRQSIDRLSFYEPAIMALAGLHKQRGQRAEAKPLYETVLKNNPYQYIAGYNLGTLELMEGEYDKAKARFSRLLAWMPEHLDARTQYGVCLARTGDRRGAIGQYDRVLAAFPDHRMARLNRALLRMEMGDVSSAERDYLYVLSRGGYLPDVSAGLSALYAETGQYEKLADFWQRAWEASGKKDDLLRARAVWSSGLAGRLDSADAGARALLQKQPAWTLPMLTRGWVCLEQGRFDEAEAWFLRAGGMKPPVPAGAIQVALGALQFKSLKEPSSPWPYYFVGVLLTGSERPAVARAGFKAFLGLSQDATWRAKANAHLASLSTSQPVSWPTSQSASQPASQPGTQR